MRDLAYRQQKIQEKRKKTPRRQFVMEICSRSPYNLYKREKQITVYNDKTRVPKIVTSKEFAINREKYTQYGCVYDVQTSFFDQLKGLLFSTPLPNITEFKENEASEFAHIVAGVKHAYLSFTITSGSENVLYSSFVKGNSINVYNSLSVTQQSENVYSAIGINQSQNIFFSRFIDHSYNIWFSNNLVGCHECVLCNGLSNQSYCIENQSYAKEAYYKRKSSILSDKKNFEQMYVSGDNTGANIHSEHVVGEAVNYSQNIRNARFVSYVHGGANIYLVGGNEPLVEVYDTFGSASWATNHCYAGVAHGSGDHHYCNYNSAFGANVYYCFHCESCSYCLGCIGLKNKSYCIFNQQYSKEERYEKVNEIFSQMDKDGTLGEFFPPSMNPFYFNDTAAYLIDPTFTKEEVTAMGYLWRDDPIKVDIPTGVQTVAVEDLGNFEGWILNGAFRPLTHFDVETFQRGNVEAKRYIDPAILKKVIIDEHGNAYRIVKMEYDFLMKHGLPLPRKHWLERMKENFRIS